MIKNFLCAFCLFFISLNGFAATGDTTIILAHTFTVLNSPPSDDDIWVSFPNTGATYQKILMRFILGCDTTGCSHWDYTVNTQLGKKSGALDSNIVSIDTIAHDTTWNYSEHVDFMEIGRLITPYGTYMDLGQQGFNRSWTHPFYYDVTDYASILKDSVSVRVHYDGWSDAFSARVEFIFIEGPPTRTVESVREIYHTSIGYASSTDFESVAVPKTFTLSPNVTSAKVVINMTGHGGSGEFDPHYFHIKVNGNDIYQHILWKEDCDYNPVSPQGGTWVFHRANWCPGDKVPIYEVDITPYITPGQPVTVDLDLDDFTPLPDGYSYILSAHLITYSSQKNNDVMLEEIIAPNSEKPYLHWNPISTRPKVKIKNAGKQPLTYAEIKYWVKGGNYWYYEWTGNLQPFEDEVITLPAFDWFGLDTNDRVFYAEAKWPNGFVDEYEFNNKQQSAFNMAPKLDTAFYIYFKSNNQPAEDNFMVRTENEDTLTFKYSFAASTIYKDTLHLPPGSYAFDINDLDTTYWGCGDGLQWWLNQQSSNNPYYETTGQINFRRMNNVVFKNFNGDFGANIHYEFTTGYSLGFNSPKTAPTEPAHNTGIAEIANSAEMKVFPNPASGIINIEVDLSQPAEGIIQLTDISGRAVREYHVDNSAHQFVMVPAADFSKGLYFVTFVSKGIKVCKRVVVQ